MQRRFFGGRKDAPPPPNRTYAHLQGASLRLGLEPPPDVADTPRDWAETGVWLTWEAPLRAIRGEHYRQMALSSLVEEAEAGNLSPRPVLLVREPTNPHDPNAIRAEIDGTEVGYVARELAGVLAPQLDAAADALVVPGVIQERRQGAETVLRVQLWLPRRLSKGPNPRIPSELLDRLVVFDWPPGEGLAETEAAPPSDPLIERFEALEVAIGEAAANRRLDRLTALVRESISMVGDYVDHMAAKLGEVPAEVVELSHSEDVPPELRTQLRESLEDSRRWAAEYSPSSLAAVSSAGSILAAWGDRALLEEMRAVLDMNDRLRSYVAQVDDYLALEALTSTIVEYVRKHPRAIQKDLWRALGADKTQVQSACYYGARVGRLEREKVGVSYALRLPRDSESTDSPRSEEGRTDH